MSATQGSSESVRVICRMRPPRDHLLKGAGQGAAGLAAAANALGAKARRGSRGEPLPAMPTAPMAAAAGSHNPATGFKIEYAPDGKSMALHMPYSAGGIKGKPYTFTFDSVLAPDSTQIDAFDAIAKETIANVLKGYNGTIFAYGQTGSGKTHTMFGPAGMPKYRGVIPRGADDLFTGIAESEELEEVTIKCSFLEVYREAIRDLLQPKNSGLKIRELPTGETYVQGLSDEYVASVEDIMSLLAVGERARSTAATDMNEVSSRSHSVLIIVVNQKLKDGSVRVGQLNLADLAGSERVERTNASGETLEEAKKINQSLSALGNCISALTDSKRTHIPFRDSTLTYLLKSSLGGNCKTTLLVCCSPEESDCLETLSTLNFAKRAKRIKNNVSVNLKLGVKELTQMVHDLRNELAVAQKTIVALQKTIRTLQAGGSIPNDMLDTLLQPFKPSATVAAIEQLTDSGVPLSEMGPVPVAMLHGNGLAQLSAPSTPPLPSSLNSSTSSSPRLTPVPAVPSALEIANLSLDGVPGLLPDSELVPTVRMALPQLPPSSDASPTTSLDLQPALPPDDPSSTASSKTTSPATVPSDGSEPAGSELDERVLRAQQEVGSLKDQLNLQSQTFTQREAEWQRERAAMQQALEAAQVQAGPQSAASAASNLAAVKERVELQHVKSKNERLEKQMIEMKETWTAYLDLILENQRAQDAERSARDLERQQALHGPASDHQKNAKVVKPVRKGGFFSSLFAGRSKPSSPQQPAPAASTDFELQPSGGPGRSSRASIGHTRSSTSGSSSAFTSPSRPPDFQRDGSVDRSVTVDEGSMSTPPHTRQLSVAGTPGASTSAVMQTSRGNFDAAIRIGYLQKKPVGWSLSLTRAWRKRLFILRPHSLDYYQIELQPGEPPSAQSSAAPSPTGSPSQHSSSVLSRASTLPNLSISTPPQPGPAGGGFVPPANLIEHLRGTIALDANTTVAATAYADAAFGIEITTSDKRAVQLHASSEADRNAWLRDIEAVLSAKRRGVDPAVLIPGFAAETPTTPGANSAFVLDAEVISNANTMLRAAIGRATLEPSPGPVAAPTLFPNDSPPPLPPRSTALSRVGDLQRNLFSASPANNSTGTEATVAAAGPAANGAASAASSSPPTAAAPAPVS